jgi:hypothetical protein
VDFERQQADRDALRAAYQELFEALSEILFRLDPVGINFEDNSDEYEPEVGTILPRLCYVTDVDDIRFVVHDEFVKWFDSDFAGPESRYDAIAKEIWGLRHLLPRPPRAH